MREEIAGGNKRVEEKDQAIVDTVEKILSELPEIIQKIKAGHPFYARFLTPEPFDPTKDSRNLNERGFYAWEVLKALKTVLLMDERLEAGVAFVTEDTITPLAARSPDVVLCAAQVVIDEYASHSEVIPDFKNKVSAADVLSMVQNPNHPVFLAKS